MAMDMAAALIPVFPFNLLRAFVISCPSRMNSISFPLIVHIPPILSVIIFFLFLFLLFLVPVLVWCLSLPVRSLCQAGPDSHGSATPSCHAHLLRTLHLISQFDSLVRTSHLPLTAPSQKQRIPFRNFLDPHVLALILIQPLFARLLYPFSG